jgi:hypothetical protein
MVGVRRLRGWQEQSGGTGFETRGGHQARSKDKGPSMDVATDDGSSTAANNIPPAFDKDSFATPRGLLALVDTFWPLGITLDPFGARHSLVESDLVYYKDDGTDAYVESWDTHACNRVWVNGPYSQPHPTDIAERVVAMTQLVNEMEVLDLRPCAPGSKCWKEHIWPHATAIAWIGRMSFVAPPGHPRAGEEIDGNRNDVALVYHGPHAQRFAFVFGTIGGYPVTVIR